MTRQVFLHSNTSMDDGEALILSDHIKSVQDLKKVAADKLGMKPPDKAYLGTGNELTAIEEIRHNDHIFFTDSNSQTPEKFHVAILGAGGVGKSAITLRFMRDSFVQNWEATIEDAYRKNVRVDDEVSTLEILDTAGQEDFSTLRAQWMQDKDGYIFVYSLLDKTSLSHLNCYIELLEQVTVGMSHIPPVAFVGNKKDLTDREPDARDVTKADIDNIIKSYKEIINRIRVVNGMASNSTVDIMGNRHDNENDYSILHFETSAFSGEKIEEMFEFIVRAIRKKRRPEAVVPTGCCFLF